MAKILIVEDDPALRADYQLQLIKKGFQADAATNGEEALKLAKSNEYDLILLDLLMPSMDGMAFLKAFDPKSHPKTKVVVSSNLQTPEGIKQVTELGASRYLTKATNSSKELVAIVREVLGA
jgi:DNA-binding response OmpR family regulator